ncbi:hypothetical protein LJR153_001327 [Paenibacillus sp. LjRoot153]|uniref:hypothetical protein n=1 Tax=Paenibacillus sp. LjRoot153 TaxID=3342270 RepID=UPI003ECC78B8
MHLNNAAAISLGLRVRGEEVVIIFALYELKLTARAYVNRMVRTDRHSNLRAQLLGN